MAAAKGKTAKGKSKKSSDATDAIAFIEEFCSITGGSAKTGEHLLEACKGDLQMAVGIFMDGGAGSQSDSNGSDTTTAAAAHGAQPDTLRAPIPQRNEMLVDEHYVPVTRGRKRTSVVFDGLRDFEAELRQNERLRVSRVASTSFASKKRTLQDLFRPPVDLIHKGSLLSARDTAVESNKWLLVNMQNVQEFCCQVLNRDVWSSQSVKSIIRRNFVFWQAYHDGEEGKRYVQFYKVKHWPYVAVLDPRTGERIVVWEKFDASSLCKIMTDFLTEQPAPDLSRVNSSTEANKGRCSIIDASEDSQMEAAIRMSMTENTAAAASNTRHLGEINDDDLETFSDSDSENHSTHTSPTKSESNGLTRLDAEKCTLSDDDKDDDIAAQKTCKRLDNVSGGSSSNHTGKQLGDASVTKDDREVTTSTSADCSKLDHDNSGPTSQILIRFPSGLRKNITLPISSTIKVIEDIVEREGWPAKTHELLINFPRRNLSQLPAASTLKDADFCSQETVYVQIRI